MLARELLVRSGDLASDDEWSQLSNGPMGEVWRCGALVVKCHQSPPSGLFTTEAAGLEALAQAGARTPTLYYVDEDGLVMDYLPAGIPHGEDLAYQLHLVHEKRAPEYGWRGAVFLGRFPLRPAALSTDWLAFWRTERIEPLLSVTAPQLGRLTKRLIALLDRYTPPTEGPRLLHGDLWSGNVIMSKQGASFIDPSVWYGERGVDLAMMRLFGGFPQTFWDTYNECFPIPAEIHESIPYYQLYYVLVHVHFFGSSYCPNVARILEYYGE